MFIVLLASLSLAAPPTDIKTVQIEYTLGLDLDKMGDMSCKISGICDCETTYTGNGKLLKGGGDMLLFKGTWQIKETTCNEALTLWVPEDKVAHHTLRLDAKGQITEWVAHADMANSSPLEKDIKAGKQVFLNEMALGFKPGEPAVHEVTEAQAESGVTLTTQHTLTITLK